MSKMRRKVTVEGDKSSDDEGGSKRNKPSVFERLGPGSASRKSFENEERCRNWVKTGVCHYGPTCRYSHGTSYKGGGRSKSRKGERESEEESKPRKHRGEKEKPRMKRSESPYPMRGPRGGNKKDKDGKMKSAVVVKKRQRGGGDSEGDSDTPTWQGGEEGQYEDLDYKDELQLEQKRQELQRVLQQLPPSEEERENITIEKKIIGASSSSDSSSSSGSSSGSSSSSSSSRSPSPPRKKKTRRPKSPPSHHPAKPVPGRSPSPVRSAPPGRSPPPHEHIRREKGHHRNEAPDIVEHERGSRREITPHPPSQGSSPSRPSSPWNAGESRSPRKQAMKGGKQVVKKKKESLKQKEKSAKLDVPGSPDRGWEDTSRDKDRDRHIEGDKIAHREKHKKRNRSPPPVPVEKTRRSKGHSLSRSPGGSRSKMKVSPSPDRKRSERRSRPDTETDTDSPQVKPSRQSPTREKIKKKKTKARALSVSPLRTKKLSPVPSRPRDEFLEKKEKVRVLSPEVPVPTEQSPEPVKRGRSPGQAFQKRKKHKDSSAEKKKKRRSTPDMMSPGKHSRKRQESPSITPVKSSKRGSVDKVPEESPTKRGSRSKSGKRKERKKIAGKYEETPPKSEDNLRSRDSGLQRHPPLSPDLNLPRGRDQRRTPPPDIFDPRSRSDGRRPPTPPRQLESPPDEFRQTGPGSPPHFSRRAREEFPPGPRRRGDEEFGRHPPGSSSPPRRGRDARYRDDFDSGHGRREPDMPGSLNRFSDPRERMGRFPPDIPPLFDDRPGPRMDPDRMFDMERGRFDRDPDHMRGRDGFERGRFGRERFSGRSDRFDSGGRGGPNWERDFPREGLDGRGLPGDRFPGRGGYDDVIPDRLSRRGDWENRHPDFREDWNSRNRSDDRRDMRMGRRGEFLEGRRFEDPAMMRRADREDMGRLRMEGNCRDRRGPPPDLRDLTFGEMRGRDDRRGEPPEPGRRDDRRRDDRGDPDRRPDKRDDSRKRVFEGEGERGRSPPIKRPRDMSPGAGSLRSHKSNREDIPAGDWDRERRQGRSLERRDRSEDRTRRGENEGIPGERKSEREGGDSKEVDRRRKREQSEGSSGRHRGRDEQSQEDGMKERSSSDRRSTRDTEKDGDKESVKSSEREAHGGRPSSQRGEADILSDKRPPKDSEAHLDKTDSLSEKFNDKDLKDRLKDRDTLSEIDWRKERGRVGSRERDSVSEKGYSSNRRRSSLDPDDFSLRRRKRSSERLRGNSNDPVLKVLDKPTAASESEPVTAGKKSAGEMYDPFDLGNRDSEERSGVIQDNDIPTEGDKSSLSGRSKRRLSAGSVAEDNQTKKQRMVELTDGGLTSYRDDHTPLTENQLPFTEETKEERQSQGGGQDVYSDWSSADDDNDILARPEDIPFTSATPSVEKPRPGVEQAVSSERKRRSPSRSSHGSRRDRSRDERGRSRDERFRDDRSRTSRPSSRHSSYERSRDERRRYEPVGQTEMVTKDEEQEDRKQTDVDDKSDLFETSMDYENISDDGDLGDEDQDNKGMVTALQIDWSGLANDHRPVITPGSAIQRFQPAQLFQRMGIDRTLAGDEMFEKITKFCQEELEGNKVEKDTEEENKKDGITESPKFSLHNDMAAFHSSTLLKLKERSNLFRNLGPFRRALCARQDLDIRRQLCKLDKMQSKSSRFPHRVAITGQN